MENDMTKNALGCQESVTFTDLQSAIPDLT